MLYSIAETEEILEKILDDTTKLSPWELGFFDDIDTTDVKHLTINQRGIIGRVWDEKYKGRS